MASLGDKWKFYSAISTSEVRNLHAPFVSLSLTTKDAQGQEATRMIEMRLEEFRNMIKSLQEIQVQMENAKTI